MYGKSSLVALATTISAASAAFQGFNYGSTFTTGAPKEQSDFEAEFTTAQGLVGAPGSGFFSARLYTMVQAGTANSPISAIPAAISTGTSLLLTLWASGGDAVFANELQALNEAIATYGGTLGKITAGISVGSEDLYRISPTGLTSSGGDPGAEPDTLTGYISQVRNAIAGTALADVPVGHVDTWTAWVNGSNQAVINSCDWIGMDAYPYFQNTMANSVEQSQSLFLSALDQTRAAVGGKPVWVTETGFPVSGATENLAVPSIDNAKTYWDQVGCPLFGTTNTWWYTLQDAEPTTPNPSFGIIGSTLTTTPLFDISCNTTDTTSSSSSSAAPSSTSSAIVASSASTSVGAVLSSSASASAASTTARVSAGTTVSASVGSSSSSVSIITTVPTSLGGGSPGGIPTSQLSLETSTLTSTASKVTASPVPSGAVGGGSGGSPSASANSTLSVSSSPKPSTVPTTAGGTRTVSGSIGAAFAALMIAILAL